MPADEIDSHVGHTPAPERVVHGRVEAPSDVEIERLTLDFLAYLELERGLSRNTLEAYRSDLLQFGEFLDRRGLNVMEARHGDLAAFLSELAAGAGERPPVAAATLARKAACLRSFYRHLRREGADRARSHRRAARARARPSACRACSRARRSRGCSSEPKGTEPLRAARPRAARGHVRVRAARLGGDRTRGERRRSRRGDAARARQGLQGAGRPDRPPGGRGAARIRAARASRRCVGYKVQTQLFVNHRGGALTRQGLYKIVQGHARGAGLEQTG